MTKQSKILIVEDDKSLIKLMTEALSQKNFEVIFALDSDEALGKAAVRRPDLIILDVLLPAKSGFDCLKKLKSRQETRDIPVIILSNLGQDEEIKKGLALGAVDYLVKADFSIDQIVAKITNHLKK